MVLQFFRSNHPGVLLTLPLVGAVLWAVSFIHPYPIPDIHGMPLFQGIHDLLKPIPWLDRLLAFVSILFGGGLLVKVAEDIQFPNEVGNVPALIYVLFMSMIPEFQWFHPLCVGNIFLILSFRKAMRIYGQGSMQSPLFDSGLALGLASLFYLPFLLFFPFIWISLIIMRAFFFREYLWALIGTLLPFLFLEVYFYWTGTPTAILDLFNEPEKGASFQVSNSEILQYVLWSLLGLFTLISVLRIFLEFPNCNLREKKQRSVFLFFLILALGGFTAINWKGGMEFQWTFMAVPLGFLFSVYFSIGSVQWLSRFFFLFWLLVIFLNYYMSSYF